MSSISPRDIKLNGATPMAESEIIRDNLRFKLVEQEVIVTNGYYEVESRYNHADDQAGIQIDLRVRAGGNSYQEADISLYNKIAAMKGKK